MSKQNKLLLQRNIFVFIFFISLGIIITQEKIGDIFLPKADKKINEYLYLHYSNELNSLNKGKTYYDNNSFKMKISSKYNKHHYFYITYKKRKIYDTYNDNYLKGKNLLEYTTKKLEKEIYEITNRAVKVTIPNTLDKYTDTIKDKIIMEDKLLNLRFYIIDDEIKIKNWQENEIATNISQLISNFKKYNITPKNYSIIITNNNDLTESIKISNITEEFLVNAYKNEIISAIINDEINQYLIDSKITYEYLN